MDNTSTGYVETIQSTSRSSNIPSESGKCLNQELGNDLTKNVLSLVGDKSLEPAYKIGCLVEDILAFYEKFALCGELSAINSVTAMGNQTSYLFRSSE
jgi:hypothetical protein